MTMQMDGYKKNPGGGMTCPICKDEFPFLVGENIPNVDVQSCEVCHEQLRAEGKIPSTPRPTERPEIFDEAGMANDKL